jgi:hypothetical protein
VLRGRERGWAGSDEPLVLEFKAEEGRLPAARSRGAGSHGGGGRSGSRCEKSGVLLCSLSGGDSVRPSTQGHEVFVVLSICLCFFVEIDGDFYCQLICTNINIANHFSIATKHMIFCCSGLRFLLGFISVFSTV